MKKIIDAALDEMDPNIGLEVGEMMIVDDEVTNEQFLGVILVFPPTEDAAGPENVLKASASVTAGAFAQLVNQGFDYPMEVVVYTHHPTKGLLPVLAFRVAVTWAREHIDGNYTLEQLLALVFDNVHGPEDIKDAEGWVPEYDLDWRNVDEPEDVGAGVDYDYWSGGKVPYPGETE